MDDYIVIGHTSFPSRDFEVHVAEGESVKDVQDKIAEIAAERPHIIYTVVPVALHRRFHPKSMLAVWAGQEN